MAKFTVTYKYPEYDQCINEAKEDIPAGDVDRLMDKFAIGEYVFLEFDTEAMTCVLVPDGNPDMQDDSYYEELNREWRVERGDEEDDDEPDAEPVDDGEEDLDIIDSPILSMKKHRNPTFQIRPSVDNGYVGESVQHIKIPRDFMQDK